MPLLEENTQSEIEVDPSVLEEGANQRQRRQMLFALALLLVALILVLLKDREFWFPPSSASEAEQAEETPPDADTASPPEKQVTGAPTVATTRPKAKQHLPTSGGAVPAAQAVPPPVVAARAVLPPLEVEVVAGDEHRTVPTASGSVRVDLQGRAPFSGDLTSARPSSPVASNGGGAMPSAAGRVRITPSAAEIVSRPVEPTYPLLAKQMKVQGAVVLDALIGKDGNIQALQVVSGPDILSDAARQAVKQWRFRPHLQSGAPVETAARITVNFTISTQ
jgi:periplasmic protein TonB